METASASVCNSEILLKSLTPVDALECTLGVPIGVRD